MRTQAARDYERKWRQKNKVHCNKLYRERILRLRMRVINGYGGKCACCGETEIKFLSIDHKFNGKGNPAKRHPNSRAMYWYILREKFPDNMQILCHNCNFSKGAYGKCPHEDMFISIEKQLNRLPFKVYEESRPDGKFKSYTIET